MGDFVEGQALCIVSDDFNVVVVNCHNGGRSDDTAHGCAKLVRVSCMLGGMVEAGRGWCGLLGVVRAFHS